MGEMKNLGISIGKDIVRESAPLVKDLLKQKINQRLSKDMGKGLFGPGGKGLYAANTKRGRGEGRVFYPGENYTREIRDGDRNATAAEIAARRARRGGAAIEDQQFSLSDVAKTGKRLFGKGLKEDAMALYNEYSDRIPKRLQMSAAQLRTLKKGGAIQIKPAMIDEAGRYAMILKPQAEAALDKALSHSKGLRVAKEHLDDLIDLKRGGSLMTNLAMAIAPKLVDKVVDSIVKKTGGAAIEDQQFSLSDVAKTGKRLFGGQAIEDQKFSLSDVAKTGKRLFGKGLRKKAMDLYGQYGDEARSIYDQYGDAARAKVGMGLREQAMGLYDKYGDDARAAYDTYSPGIRAKVGMGVIQLGTPYAQDSQKYGSAMHPLVPTVNPFGAYVKL